MNLTLRSAKMKHLSFLEDLLKNGQFGGEYDSKIYINDCIYLLKTELYPKTNNVKDLKADFNLIPGMEALGFSHNESVILAYLITTDRSIAINEITKVTSLERGKVYRIMQSLFERGIIMRTDIEYARYMIKNRDDPFAPLILAKQEEIDVIRKFKIIA